MAEREVVVLHEKARGCGFRRAGPTGVGIYLMGPGGSEACERLPLPLEVCPCCGQGIKFSRGFTWVEPASLFDPKIEPKCLLALDEPDPGLVALYADHNHEGCPMCNPSKIAGDKAGLLWIGGKNYTPQSFKREAAQMGISRRLPSIPRGFMVGSHYVYLAHKQAAYPEGWPDVEPGAKARAGVFYVFKPTHVDLVIDDKDQIPERAERLLDKLGDKGRLVQVIPDQDTQGTLFEGVD